MSESGTDVVVTGVAWVGGGIGSIESALERLFREAELEIMLTAYAISSGVDLLFDCMETALDRGVQIRLIVNRLSNQPPDVCTQLYQLTVLYPHFHLYDFVSDREADLHAKVIVADHRLALVGSSNLSRRGLLANHEMAVLVQGPDAAAVASALDRLLASKYVRSARQMIGQ